MVIRTSLCPSSLPALDGGRVGSGGTLGGRVFPLWFQGWCLEEAMCVTWSLSGVISLGSSSSYTPVHGGGLGGAPEPGRQTYWPLAGTSQVDTELGVQWALPAWWVVPLPRASNFTPSGKACSVL